MSVGDTLHLPLTWSGGTERGAERRVLIGLVFPVPLGVTQPPRCILASGVEWKCSVCVSVWYQVSQSPVFAVWVRQWSWLCMWGKNAVVSCLLGLLPLCCCCNGSETTCFRAEQTLSTKTSNKIKPNENVLPMMTHETQEPEEVT